MAVIYLESGTDATGDLSFYPTNSGAAISDSTIYHSGTRSLQLSTGSGPTLAYVDGPAGTLADTGRRISFFFRFNALPTTSVSFLGLYAGSTLVASLYLLHTGYLSIVPAGATTVNGTTTLLSITTWYRICLSYTITNTTTFRFQAYVNGFAEINATAGTLTNTGTTLFSFRANTAGGTSFTLWFDDVYIDNGSDYSDPGFIQVAAKRPYSNGTSNAFTTQIGSGPASPYGTGHAQQVNEIPLNAANGWSLSTTTLATEEYSIEGLAVGVNLTGYTIVDFMGWIWASIASTSNSPVQKLILAGTGTTKTMTTTPAFYYAVAGSTSYPAGNTDIGMSTQFTSTAHLASLFECGIVIAYRVPYTQALTASMATFVGAISKKISAFFNAS